MRTFTRLPALSLVAAFAMTTAGCDRSPTRPGTDPLAGPSVKTLDIVGPATLPPGASAQFSISATWSDGVPREVRGVNWTSSSPDVVFIDSSGKATAHKGGRAYISATAGGRSALAVRLLVLPHGTFWVSGDVNDGAYAVEAAFVEAVSGADTVTAVTGYDGQFHLFGVRPDAVLRVSKEGYATFEQNLQLTTDRTIRIHLALARDRLHIAGDYTLTITADACTDPAPLAQHLRRRTYRARVIQTEERVAVTVTGGDFVSYERYVANQIAGFVFPTTATFVLWPGDWMDPPGLAERFGDGTMLVFDGRAIVRATASGLSGTFDGTFIHQEPGGMTRIIGSCKSASHTFTLTR